jgi:hypothetical protein
MEGDTELRSKISLGYEALIPVNDVPSTIRQIKIWVKTSYPKANSYRGRFSTYVKTLHTDTTVCSRSD